MLTTFKSHKLKVKKSQQYPSYRNYVHFQWGDANPSKDMLFGEDVQSQWGCTFPMIHIPIPGKDMHSQGGTFPFLVRMCNTGESHPHSWWGCAFVAGMNHKGIHILTSNEDVPHWEWGMWLTSNAQPHWEWGRASLGMHILIGSGDVTHTECTSSLGMHTLTRNAHPHRECT